VFDLPKIGNSMIPSQTTAFSSLPFLMFTPHLRFSSAQGATATATGTIIITGAGGMECPGDDLVTMTRRMAVSKVVECKTSWWFQPLRKTVVNLDYVPKFRDEHLKKFWKSPPPRKFLQQVLHAAHVNRVMG